MNLPVFPALIAAAAFFSPVRARAAGHVVFVPFLWTRGADRGGPKSYNPRCLPREVPVEVAVLSPYGGDFESRRTAWAKPACAPEITSRAPDRQPGFPLL